MPSAYDRSNSSSKYSSSAGRSACYNRSGAYGQNYSSSNSSYRSNASAGNEMRRSDSGYGSSQGDHQRAISPPRCPAEQPRHTRACNTEDYRSVSPINSSRYEQPYDRSCSRDTPKAIPHSGFRSGQTYEALGSQTQEAGLSRSKAVRGRQNERGFGVTGYSGGAMDARYVPSREQRSGANFGSGGFSSYEHY